MAAPEHRGRHLRVSRIVQPSGQTPDGMRGRSVLTRHQVDRRVLASSVDLEVELELVALVEALQPRALDRADVDERVRLPVVAGDEAEALHRVEELDSARRLLAGQLALRRGRALLDRDDVADDLEIARRDLAAAVDQVELQLLVFGQTVKPSTLDRADMDEDVLAAVIAGDEAEALLGVEELDLAAAGADDLRRHPAGAPAAARSAAAEAVATAPAEAAAARPVAAAEAASAAASAVAAASAIATTEPAAVAAEAAAARVGIETAAFFTETVALVAATAATSSIETHS